MLKKIIILFSILPALYQQANCQGCSDAGFCTIGSLQPQHTINSKYKNSFKISGAFGLGEQHTNIYQLSPEINFSLFKNNMLQLKIPFLIVKGNIGSNSGAGDISFSTTQRLKKTTNLKFDISLGIKIATGNTNAKENDLSLPMVYQAGLGTNDIILGTSLQLKKWNFSAGYQGILANKNKNGFLHNTWLTNYPAQKYFESNLLDRGSDALIRVERAFNINKINFFAGILAIDHLKKSSFVNGAGTRITIEKSNGLTLNITGNAQFDFSKRTGINLSFGFPAVVRKARPDGLTRDLVIATTFEYHF